jgi:hypothetical protein
MTKHFICITASLIVITGALLSTVVAAEQPSSALATSTPEPSVISEVAARIIAAEIPREYQHSKDWGRTKGVTTGLRSSGNFFKFDIHRQRTEVNDGIWKKYKLTLVEPEKNLDVTIENLRTLDSGRLALTLNVQAKVQGWARAKVYEHGVHIIAVEAEGDTNVRLSLDANIGIKTAMANNYLPCVTIDPVVTDARLKFDDFQLRRISDLRGTLAHELGILLREAVEDELKGPKLAEKINASIKKHPERLQLSADRLIGSGSSTSRKNASAKNADSGQITK